MKMANQQSEIGLQSIWQLAKIKAESRWLKYGGYQLSAMAGVKTRRRKRGVSSAGSYRRANLNGWAGGISGYSGNAAIQ